jgi:uncharacterized protein (DUF58 family)
VILGSVLLVGLLAPGRAVAKTRVLVVSAPIDAVVGEPVELSVVASARVRIRPVSPEGITRFVGPRGAARDSRETDVPTVRVVPARRGILNSVTVDVASAAPFGLVWWSRRTTLALPVEVCVAPRPTKAFTIPPQGNDFGDESEGQRSAAFGETRGVRDYEHGDARRTVHWRSSAHTGRLMVREMEMPTAEPVIVRVSLPHDPVAADEMAARGLATVIALLDRSRPVMLSTYEPTGERLAQVSGPKDAGRRLARAVASGDGPGAVTIDERANPPGTGRSTTFPSTQGNSR